MALSRSETIRAFYQTLFRAWGRQHWWPARSRFEVVVGAFLTQNTAWANVEKALAQLRRARVLSLRGIRNTPLPQLEQLIRSAGYYRQKAARLKNFVAYLDERHAGSLQRMFTRPTAELRAELLALNGIGPETADSILLYAGNHPVFVVDAYTRRILDRHRILPPNAPYDDIRNLFEGALGTPEFVAQCEGDPHLPATDHQPLASPEGSCHSPSRMSTIRRTATAQVFNEMHGLIVGVGKNFCLKSKALCDQCPLRLFLPVRGPRLTPQAPARRPRLR
ncbi:MAG: endonuclease III domain-containing protein [Acidobacteriia bacterium]|nr:endonuclease III domain-containing protein [Terriglobia bacterium]